jgi:hypothetical protein
MAYRCGFVIRPKFNLQLAVAYLINDLELVIVIGKHNPVTVSEGREIEVGWLGDFSGR